jgi:hypothetical protein
MGRLARRGQPHFDATLIAGRAAEAPVFSFSSPPENTSEHFQEKARPREGRGGIRFPVRKSDNAKMLERFLFPANVKPV